MVMQTKLFSATVKSQKAAPESLAYLAKQMKIIQDYIAPVIRLSQSDSKFRFEELYGTAFFINGEGVFITASHVIQAARNEVEKKGGSIALVSVRP